MSPMTLIDVYMLEPLIRRLFPAPPDRAIGVKILQPGDNNIRILCLCGAFCVDAGHVWSRWMRDFRKYFRGAEIVTINGFYYYWEQDRGAIEDLIMNGIELVSDNKPTYIVAFSFGGLIAKGIVARSESHQIRSIISMATEHRGHLPRIATMRDQLLDIPLDVDVPMYTFGGLFDAIVWPWTTHTNRSAHSFLPVGHFAFVRSGKTRARVIGVLQRLVSNDIRNHTLAASENEK